MENSPARRSRGSAWCSRRREIGPDPAAIRDYAQAVEALGFDHIIVPDRVVGVNTDRPDRQGQAGRTRGRPRLQEPFVLLGFLRPATTRLGLVTGVLVLPQRQTVLVAKQAATVDVLSGGRLRLGVGVGGALSEPESDALGAAFRVRGAREAEQIRLLRRLWTRAAGDLRGPLGPRPGRGALPAAGAAADPHLDRRGHVSGLAGGRARAAAGWVGSATAG